MFVSYSQAADSDLAPKVARGLELFAKPWNRRRSLSVFSDVWALGLTPGLWESIAEALERSRWLVILLSPGASESPWVNDEIEHWFSLGPDRAERTLLVLTGGSLNWDDELGDFDSSSSALPRALRGRFQQEPLHLDLRWIREAETSGLDVDLSLANSQFRSAISTIVAPVRGLSRYEIDGEAIRQEKRTRRYRNGAAVGLVALTVVALVAAGLASTNQREAERNAELAEARAEELAREALIADANGLAAASLAAERPQNAAILAIEASSVTPEPTPLALAALGEAANRLTDSELVATISGGAPDQLFWTADGRLLAGALPDEGDPWSFDGESMEVVSAPGGSRWWSPDGSSIVELDGTDIELRDLTSEQTRSVNGITPEDSRVAPERAIAASPGTAELALDTGTGIVIVSTTDATSRFELDLPALTASASYRRINWSADGSLLAVTTDDGLVRVIAENSTVRQYRRSLPPGSFQRDLGEPLSPQARWLAVYDEVHSDESQSRIDGVRIFDLEADADQGRLFDIDFANTMAWSPHGDLLAVGGRLGARSSVQLIDPTTGRLASELAVETANNDRSQITAIAWDHLGGRLAVGLATGTVVVLNVFNGDVLNELVASGPARHLAWSADGLHLAGSIAHNTAAEGQTFVWRVRHGAESSAVPLPPLGGGPPGAGSSFLAMSGFSPIGSRAFGVASRNNFVHTLDGTTGETLSSMWSEVLSEGQFGQAGSFWSSSGKVAIWVNNKDSSYTVEIWDTNEDWKLVDKVVMPTGEQFAIGTEGIAHAKWSPGGQRLAVVGGAQVHVIDVDSGSGTDQTPGLSLTTEPISIDWLNPSSLVIVEGPDSGQAARLQVWDVEADRVEASFHYPDVAWSPAVAALASNRSEVLVGDVNGQVSTLAGPEWQLVGKELNAHDDRVSALAASESAGIFVTASGGNVTVWDLDRRVPRQELTLDQEIAEIVIHPDGQTLYLHDRSTIFRAHAMTIGQLCQASLLAVDRDELKVLAPGHERFLCLDKEIPQRFENEIAGWTQAPYPAPVETLLPGGSHVVGPVQMSVAGKGVTLDFPGVWTKISPGFGESFAFSANESYQNRMWNNSNVRLCRILGIWWPQLVRVPFEPLPSFVNDRTVVLNPPSTHALDRLGDSRISIDQVRAELLAVNDDDGSGARSIERLADEEILGHQAEVYRFRNPDESPEFCYPNHAKYWLFEIDGRPWSVVAYSNGSEIDYDAHLAQVAEIVDGAVLE